MTKTTEIPWQQHDDVKPYGSSYAATIWTSAGPGYGLVADCRGTSLGRAVEIENAKLIVRAVNSHAALVEALEKVRNELWVDYCLGMGRTDCDPASFNSRPHIRIIDAALTLAKGA